MLNWKVGKVGRANSIARQKISEDMLKPEQQRYLVIEQESASTTHFVELFNCQLHETQLYHMGSLTTVS